MNVGLQQIRQFKLASSSNPIREAQFFGPVLLFATQTHVHYVTVQGVSNVLISFDNFESKNHISMALIDRLLVIGKSRVLQSGGQQQKRRVHHHVQLEFKEKAYSILEPLLCGYLALCQHARQEPDKELVKSLVRVFANNKFSQSLVDQLNQLGYFEVSEFLLSRHDVKQIRDEEKILVKQQLLDTEGYLDILFPMKNIIDSDGDRVEMIKKLHSDPRYMSVKYNIKMLENYFLHIGNFQSAFKMSRILNESKHYLMLNHPSLNEKILESFQKTELGDSLKSQSLQASDGNTEFRTQ